ncbi:hypothetical protein FA95DRAFT_1577266 [Auriscalpium vulgare]|uniref:Uncharacterized protein n=1 Tax=Auriscalpium vulgare TaxID=40419 RepID=A0ACB8R7N7_9AGAM|nr:hypothetical protein FA95DRAFT_1577266 [Auriscalpium vulgare]
MSSVDLDQLQCRIYVAALSVSRMGRDEQCDGLRRLLREAVKFVFNSAVSFNARLATREDGCILPPYMGKVFRIIADAYRARDGDNISLTLSDFLSDAPPRYKEVELGEDRWWEQVPLKVHRVYTDKDGKRQRVDVTSSLASSSKAVPPPAMEIDDVEKRLADCHQLLNDLKSNMKSVEDEVWRNDRRSLKLISASDALNEEFNYLTEVYKGLRIDWLKMQHSLKKHKNCDF